MMSANRWWRWFPYKNVHDSMVMIMWYTLFTFFLMILSEILKNKMKETEWILVNFDWHVNKSDTNVPAMHAEPSLVTSGCVWSHTCIVKVFTDVRSIAEHGHNWTWLVTARMTQFGPCAMWSFKAHNQARPTIDSQHKQGCTNKTNSLS